MNNCPICKSNAEELETRTPEMHAIRCETHGEFEFSNTLTHITLWSAPREVWERALQNAKSRTGPGVRPKIIRDDFFGFAS
jgi:hypothetical protein